MRRLVITLLVAIVASYADAQQAYNADLIPKELLSHASAVTRVDQTTAEIKDKDNVIYHYKLVRTILNSNGDRFAGLDEWHNKSRIIKSIKGYVYNEMGVQTGKFSDSDFQDDSYSDGFSLFEDVRYKHFKPGAIAYPYTVEYDYEIRSRQSMNIEPWYAIPEQGVSVEHSAYILICKPDLKLKFKEVNYAGQAVVGVTTDGMKTFTWQADNLKALRDEPYSPNPALYLTHVSIAPQDFVYEGIAGSYTNWNELGKWIYDKLLYGRTTLSPETVAAIKELTSGAATPKEKAKRIYEYMQQKTHYISIQIGIGGYQPFSASDVDKLGYGDCKGLVNYTQALLKVADIDSYYCVVKSGSKKSSLMTDFASMDQADHIILCLPFKNDTTWLECTSKNIPFGYLGNFTDDRRVLACTPQGGRLIHTPKYVADENLEDKKASFTLSENGSLDGSMHTSFGGTQYEDRDYLLNETYQDQVKAIKKDYPINNMEIESLKFNPVKKENPVITETITLKAGEYASAENGKMSFLVNAANRVANAPLNVRNRTAPLYINRGYTDTDNVTYTLPDGYTPDRNLLNVELHKNFGNYAAHVTITGNRLTYTRKLQLIDGTYSKEDYDELVNFYQTVVDADHYTMTLVKDKK